MNIIICEKQGIVVVDGVIYEKQTEIDYVIVAGLKWDKKNITDKLCTFQEANSIALNACKRLPTKEEFQKLSKCYSVWDNELKGKWFSNEKNDLKNPNKSLFLPAAGDRSTDGAVYNQGTSGSYWSSTPYSSSYAYNLNLNSSNVYPSCNDNRSLGFAVRCVNNLNK